MYSTPIGLLIWKGIENKHAVIEGLRNSSTTFIGLLIWKDTENEHAIIKGLRNSFIIYITPNALFLSFPLFYYDDDDASGESREAVLWKEGRKTAVERRKIAVERRLLRVMVIDKGGDYGAEILARYYWLIYAFQTIA